MSTIFHHEFKKKLLCLGHPLCAVLFFSGALLIGSALVVAGFKEKFIGRASIIDVVIVNNKSLSLCETQHRPYGSETLPRGIVSATTDLERKPLWGNNKDLKKPSNLLAMAVGIKQKENVDKIVKKFLSSGLNFIPILFHYDGIVDEWRDLEWSPNTTHIAAINQTKWWFAKRFLHPDVVSEYEYIFLWDEDLGIDNFHPERYISIIKEEGLEISQPALDPKRSEVHHRLTKRQERSRVHRRVDRRIGNARCDKNVTGPPCSGFVEMMAPVFSKASWRCTWYMIQNDLVHGWGVDFQLGYCAQGDLTKNVGIVDSEYIIHYGLPTLGGSTADKGKLYNQTRDRAKVKSWSYVELDIFKRRWRKAVEDDNCWTDIYTNNQT